MKEENEEEANYLENFDRIFGTKVNKKIKLNMPMLHIIFENFREDVYSPSKKYKELRRKKIELFNKFRKDLRDEQMKIFNNYNEIENQITEKIEEQLFMFGYIVATELLNEVEINIKKYNSSFQPLKFIDISTKNINDVN